MWYPKGEEREAIVKAMARASDEALDEAYDYGVAKPGSFGYACNLQSAEDVLALLERGETDIEVLASTSHEGWAKIAHTFDDPIYKTKPSKRQKREELASTTYQDLPEEEKEKDRVAARALLKEYRIQKRKVEDNSPRSE